jgi:hypothetical protein
MNREDYIGNVAVIGAPNSGKTQFAKWLGKEYIYVGPREHVDYKEDAAKIAKHIRSNGPFVFDEVNDFELLMWLKYRLGQLTVVCCTRNDYYIKQMTREQTDAVAAYLMYGPQIEQHARETFDVLDVFITGDEFSLI